MAKDIIDPAEIDLTALLGSRLCHDLISPIGAIGNGLELLELAQSSPSEEVALIRASVSAAAARIKFFRIAFGAAQADQTVSAKEISAVIDAAYADTRLSVSWSAPGEHARAEVKIACLALACIDHALAWGGQIDIRRASSSWVLHATADRLKYTPELWDHLTKGTPMADLSGGEVQFGLLADIARRARRPVSVTATERNLSILI